MRAVISGHSFLLVLLMTLASCAAPVKEQARSGFISDYSSLEEVSKNAYLFTSPKVANYDKFRIEGPFILIEDLPDTDKPEFSDEEIDELRHYFRERLSEAITEDDGYLVVDEPGDGVATIRIAITAADATVGALNITIYTKVTGAGLGGAAMEGEMVDSVSGEQLAAAVQWGSGSRVMRAGFTKLGDAKLQINRWTRKLRERIDFAHASDESERKS